MSLTLSHFRIPPRLLQWGTTLLAVVVSGVLLLVYLVPIAPALPLREVLAQTPLAHIFYVLWMIVAGIIAGLRIVRPETLLEKLSQGISRVPYEVVWAITILSWMCIAYALIVWTVNISAPIAIIVCLTAFLIHVCIPYTYSRIAPDQQFSLRSGIISRQKWIGIGTGIVWLLLSQFGWYDLLHNDHTQILIGLCLFIVPGMAIQHIVFADECWRWIRAIGFGLIFSVVLALAIFAIGLIFALSATLVKLLFGLIGAGWIIYAIGFRTLPERQQPSEIQSLSDHVLVLGAVTAIFIAMLFASLEMKWIKVSGIDTDFIVYNALATEFTQTDALSWNEPYFNTGTRLPVRFMFGNFPGIQAVITNLGDAHPLNTFLVLQVLLVPFAFLGINELARRLNLSLEYRMLAIILSVFTLVSLTHTYQAGLNFFGRLIQDKLFIAFIYFPFLFALYIDYLKQPTKKRSGIVCLLAFATPFLHATSFAWTAMILGVYSVLMWIRHRMILRTLPVLIVIVVGLLLPFLANRLEPGFDYYSRFQSEETEESPQAYITHLERVVVLDDGSYLGINPRLMSTRIAQLLFVGFVLAVVLAWWDDLALFVLAFAILFVCLKIPITFKLISSAITEWHTWRYTWFIPYGFTVLLIVVAGFRIWDRLPIAKTFQPIRGMILSLLGVVVLFVTMGRAGYPIIRSDLDLYLLHQQTQPHIPTLSAIDAYDELADIGRLVESSTTGPVGVTLMIDQVGHLHTLVPSIYYQAQPISWIKYFARANLPFETFGKPRDEDFERLNAPNTPANERLSILDTYSIRYVLVMVGRDSIASMFLDSHPDHFTPEYEGQLFGVYRYQS